MKLRLFQVDAFTDHLFAGNPAAVCPMEEWLPDDVMQSIAAENNLAETAFFVRNHEEYDLRWFTPTREVDLCGHATLASAHVLFQVLDPSLGSVTFRTLSGPLRVDRDGAWLSMRLPRREPAACEAPAALLEGLGSTPGHVLRSRDYMAVYGSEDDVRSLRPDMTRLASLDALGVIVTAPATRFDFVSRFFAPAAGVPEDPVTGSAHCTLVPYWAKRLGKQTLHARQVSARGGELLCRDEPPHSVVLAGHAVLYLEGSIQTS